MFAVAQAISIPGDVAENVARHVRLAAVAAAQGARLVVFPELSLTSYNIGLTARDAIAVDDGRLAPLAGLAASQSLTIVAGAPLAAGMATRGETSAAFDGRCIPAGGVAPPLNTPGMRGRRALPSGRLARLGATPGFHHGLPGLQIAALVFHPDGRRSTYTKQFLHDGEEIAFRPGAGGVPVTVGEDLVGLAICADITHPEHAAAAAGRAATVYAAGVLISDNGYAADTALMQRYAAEHRMLVLMANYGAPTGGWVSAGRSAVWRPDGRLLAEAPASGEAVIVAGRRGVEWGVRVVLGDGGSDA